MESSDSGKVGHVSISIREEENQQTSAAAAAANPQLKFYFAVLYVLALLFMTVSLMLPAIFQNNRQSTFKTRAGFFIIGAIVSFSVAILASAILIFTSHCLQSLMRDIHYTIFKCIGYFSATIATFCLLVLLLVPPDLNPWIAYPVICILFTATLFAFYLFWKHVGARQPDDDHFPIILPATFFLFVPLFVALCAFISPDLHWIRYMVLCLDLTILAAFCFVIAYMTLFYGRKQHDMEPHPMIQQDHQSSSVISLAT